MKTQAKFLWNRNVLALDRKHAELKERGRRTEAERRRFLADIAECENASMSPFRGLRDRQRAPFLRTDQ